MLFRMKRSKFEMDEAQGLPERIRKLRKAVKLTQAEFAQELGVEQASVSRWENGSEPTLENLQALMSFSKERRIEIGLIDGFNDVFRWSEKPGPVYIPVLGGVDAGGKVNFYEVEKVLGSRTKKSTHPVVDLMEDAARTFWILDDDEKSKDGTAYRQEIEDYLQAKGGWGHSLAKAPPDFTRTMVGLVFDHGSYYPILDESCVFYIDLLEKSLFRDLYGALSLILLDDGRSFIGRLFHSDNTSHHTVVTLGGPVSGIKAVWLRKVLYISYPEK